MNNIVNKEIEPWIRPWNMETFDDLYNRDERFFSIVIKGAISWLNRNIVMYNKPINHFIFNTGSSIMFIESDGYNFSWQETSGEDQMYMHLPRCVMKLDNLNIPTEELTNPYARGNYERRCKNNIQGFNAEIRRIPVELSVTLEYVLANFNESIVLLQELIDKILFQKYFNVTYLGQVIRCSIEFPGDSQIEFDNIDLSQPQSNNKHINIAIKICTNYPMINERSEISTNNIIESFDGSLFLDKNINKPDDQINTDKEKYNI